MGRLTGSRRSTRALANEVKAIGESFREGTPVIMNLTEMDDADAKRLSTSRPAWLRPARRHRTGHREGLLAPRPTSKSPPRSPAVRSPRSPFNQS
jgi:cell division inhibitor SepF